MSVIVETTLGDITIDLFVKRRPRACTNFLKLCKMKYYNFNLFHTINRGFIAQTGDPTGSRSGGESVWGVIEGEERRYFEAETIPRIKHTTAGLVSFVGVKNQMLGSQFFITLAPDLMYLDEHHCVFGEVVEGLDVLDILNEAICDTEHRPYKDIRITHTVILQDPFPDPKGFIEPDQSPTATAERLQGGRIAPDEEIDESDGKTLKEISEIVADREAKARATILEMVGDIPDADIAPPENVLFVCKLNPVTNDDDLEIIFSRFGKIKTCEVIRDKKTGDSLQYAFVEFEEQKSCEDAYFKMDNVLIDDRRIHVDFSQSVAKVKWLGKGRGVRHYDDEGQTRKGDFRNDIGNGRYKSSNRRNDGPPAQDQLRRGDKFEGHPRDYRGPPKDRRNYNRDNEFQRRNKSGFDKSRGYYPEEQFRDRRRRSRSNSGGRLRDQRRTDERNRNNRNRESSEDRPNKEDRKSYKKRRETSRESPDEERREAKRSNPFKEDKQRLVSEDRSYSSRSWGQSSKDRSRNDQSRKRYEEPIEDKYSSRSRSDNAKSKHGVQERSKENSEKGERDDSKILRKRRENDSSEDEEDNAREKHKKSSKKGKKKKKKKSKKESSSSESSSDSSSESDERDKKRKKKSRK